MIWCRPPPRWDKPNKGTSHLRSPFIFYAQKQKRRKLQMARKPKTASRALALLLAAIMTVGSFQTTTYAADYGNGGSLVNASALIDDPVSGVTGSGWDNIGLGGSNTPTETPPEDGKKSSRCFCTGLTQSHSTVTDFARLRGLSTSQPL